MFSEDLRPQVGLAAVCLLAGNRGGPVSHSQRNSNPRIQRLVHWVQAQRSEDTPLTRGDALLTSGRCSPISSLDQLWPSRQVPRTS